MARQPTMQPPMAQTQQVLQPPTNRGGRPVNFSDTNIQGIPPGATITSPAVSRGGGSVGSSGSAVADTIGVLGNLATGIFDIQQQGEQNKVLGMFMQSQLNIADAVEQGAMSSSEARTRMRANFKQAIASNPSMSSTLTDAHKQIVNTKGLGNIAVEGTEAEKSALKVMNEAEQAGYGRSEEGAQKYLQFQRANDIINFESKQLALQEKRTSLENDAIRRKTEKAINDIADSAFYRTQNKINDVIAGVNEGTMDRESAVVQLDQLSAEYSRALNQLGGASVGNDFIKAQAEPALSLINTAKDFISGKVGADIYGNQKKVVLGKQNLNILADPEASRFVALTNLLGPGSLGVIGDITAGRIFLNKLFNNSDPTKTPANLTEPETSRSTKEMLDVIKGNMNSLDTNNPLIDKDGVNQELNNQITNLFRGINIYSSSVENPKQYNELVDFMTSPEFDRWFERNQGNVNQDIVDKAKLVIKRQYVDAAIPVIRDSFLSANVLAMKKLDPAERPLGGSFPQYDKLVGNEVFEPTFENGTVRFKMKEKFKDPENEFDVVSTADDLNSDLSPILNRIIRLYSSLNPGFTKGEIWNNIVKPDFFGISNNENNQNNEEAQ